VSYVADPDVELHEPPQHSLPVVQSEPLLKQLPPLELPLVEVGKLSAMSG